MSIMTALVHRVLVIIAVIFTAGFVAGYLIGCSDQPRKPVQPLRCAEGLIVFCDRICSCADPRDLERAVPELPGH